MDFLSDRLNLDLFAQVLFPNFSQLISEFFVFPPEGHDLIQKEFILLPEKFDLIDLGNGSAGVNASLRCLIWGIGTGVRRFRPLGGLIPLKNVLCPDAGAAAGVAGVGGDIIIILSGYFLGSGAYDPPSLGEQRFDSRS
jgi:hypothetical protein